MNLALHTLSDEKPSPVLNINFNSSGSLFATATTDGWVVYGTEPLRIISKREFPNASLRFVLPLAQTNILFLVGGPSSPLYSPNKVVIWDDQLGKPVAELEFREEIKGLTARRDRLVVVLRRRVVIFVLGEGGLGIWREGVYATTDNLRGLVALSTEEGSTLLAFPGRQIGQVQIVRLPPLRSSARSLPPPPSHDPAAPPFPSVSIIVAHTSSLSSLATTPSGSLLATSSVTGTLVRVWNPSLSSLVKELRRGTDSAEIFGISFRSDGGGLCVTSDKGTVHIWDLNSTRADSGSRENDEDSIADARQKQFNLLKPYLPKYFSSEWSHSQFRLPPPAPTASRLPFSLVPPASATSTGPLTVEDDVCLCIWIERVDQQAVLREEERRKAQIMSFRAKGKQRESATERLPFLAPIESAIPEPQIIALTRSGGWYRISLDSSSINRKDRPEAKFGLSKESTSECRLEEYRRFGSRDGW